MPTDDIEVEKVLDIIIEVFGRYNLKNTNQYRIVLSDSALFRESVLDRSESVSDMSLIIYDLVQTYNKHAPTPLVTDVIQAILNDSWKLEKYFETN